MHKPHILQPSRQLACHHTLSHDNTPMSSENTKRLAKNTLVLYVRMFFGMLVSLYTSRVILEALGVEDFGIYNVVGGFVVMFSVISTSLTSAIGRFVTYELGAGNEGSLRQVFSTSVIIQAVLALLVLTAAEVVGGWFLNTQMNIPAERMGAANWAFQASVLSFCIGLLSCPYSALISSHERMGVVAFVGIADIIVKLFIVIAVAHLPLGIDRLIVYAWLLVLATIAVQLMNFGYCWHKFEVSHTRIRFYKSCWKEMSKFAGWNTIGSIAELLREQGVNVLMNIFFGPVANAARGICNQVNGALNSCIGSFVTALSPQITKSYAAGETAYLHSLVKRGSRFSFYVMMLPAIPLLLEAPYVLTLWLKKYPDNAVVFTRLIIVYSLINILSNTLITLQNATGKIRNYQIGVGFMLMMNFPLSYAVFKLGCPAYSAYIVAIAVGIACLLLRLYFLRCMVEGFSAFNYLLSVCGNVVFVSVLAVILPFAVHLVLPTGFVRLGCVVTVTLLAGAASVLYVGCTANERQFIFSKAAAFVKRFKHD